MLHRLRRQLLHRHEHDCADPPGITRLAQAITAAVTSEELELVAAAERDLAAGVADLPETEPAVAEPAAPSPTTLELGAPALDTADQDFLGRADAARAAAGAAAIVLVSVPGHVDTGATLPPEQRKQLNDAVADRVIATLEGPWQVELGSGRSEVLVLVHGDRLGERFSRKLRELTAELALPIPLAERQMIIRPHLGIAPLTTGVSSAAALAAARTGLPAAPCASWTAAEEPDGEEDLLPRLALLAGARAALAAGRFVMLYRHIQRIDTNGLVGTHAVPGWVDENDRTHTFTELGGLADTTRLAELMIEQALPAICRDLALWRAQRLRVTPFVLLELPEQVLRDRYLAGRLAGFLRTSPVPPSLLVFGIPAAALLGIDGIDEHLHELSDTGVQLAICDYGDSSTPLAVLTRHRWQLAVLPHAVVNKLEDRNAEAAEAERDIVTTLVETARRLGIHPIADDTTLSIATRYLEPGLYISPIRAAETAADVVERIWTWTSLPPGPPDPADFTNVGKKNDEHAGETLPAQRAH